MPFYAHPLREPSIIPLLKYFCKKGYATITGALDTTITPYFISVVSWRRNNCISSFIASSASPPHLFANQHLTQYKLQRNLVTVGNINALKKEFQCQHRNRAITPINAFDTGKTINRKVLAWEQPSIIAASSSSWGTPVIKSPCNNKVICTHSTNYQ